jgi:hypothetical protein
MTDVIRTPRSGQIVVMFGVALVAIALIVGLVVDGGMAFLQRRDAQNDADLAALAGTKVIANAWMDPEQEGASRATAYATIQQQLIRSGCTTAAHCTWTAHLVGPGLADLGVLTGGGGSVAGSGRPILGVRIDVLRRPRTFFLGLVGQSAWQVDATATALTSRPTTAPAGQLLPLALHEPDKDHPFTKGQLYDLTPDKLAPGGFAWVTWPGKGSVSGSTCNPDNPPLDLTGRGTVASRATGYTWSQIRDCLIRWQRSGSTVLIPIYAADSTPPKYRIVGVAAFTIKTVPNSSEGDVQASFAGSFAYPVATSASDQPPGPQDSLYYLGLVK